MMVTLDTFFSQSGKRDIRTIGAYVQAHVDAYWQGAFERTNNEMVARYPEIGDSVYGIYGTELFRDVHAQLKQAGLRATPRLPGTFGISREWGDSEEDRQRWMWSKVTTEDGRAVGTIVTVFYHDHIAIRIPRAFRMIALEETSKGAVVAALSRLSPEFAASEEATVEIARYMASLERGEA